MTCPVCGARQKWQTVRFGRPFPCISCGENLRVPDFYTKRILIVSLSVSIVILYALGQRELTIFLLAALICLPVSVVVGSVMRHLWPPVLQLDPGQDGLRISPR